MHIALHQRLLWASLTLVEAFFYRRQVTQRSSVLLEMPTVTLLRVCGERRNIQEERKEADPLKDIRG